MRREWICFALLMLGLTLTATPGLLTPPLARADDYPFQSQPFVMDGVIKRVDIDRDRVVFNGDNGRQYTLDTSQSEITLMDGNRAGLTGDLSAGMHIHVSGRLLSAGIAEVDQMHILDDSQPSRPRLTRPVSPQEVNSGVIHPEDIELRGTVSTIDTRNGSFVVRVKDKVGEHTRTILLADNTDISGMGLWTQTSFR